MDTNAAIAFTRFGLGRRHGEPVPPDPKAWLKAQLVGPDTAPTAGLPTTADALAIVHAATMAAKTTTGDPKNSPEFQAFRALARAEPEALMANAITTPAGFRERLVWFWYNHFTVGARSRPTAACVGPYLREAIRPNVNGRFRDMVLAVMRHPAMLAYLDQQTSVGPNSPVGLRHKRGLNENLARECLELHTVTPAAGYTQADVTSLAKVLTGWKWDNKHPPFSFAFEVDTHEPGPQTVLGRTWPDGEEGGVALLDYLATHPATYHHLAFKLVRHFVTDDPPPADVARIEAVLSETNGDLSAASQALVDLQSAWTPLMKLRPPQDYIIAAMRAVGANPAYEPNLAGMAANLGQPVFGAPFPIGWPDRGEDWSNPEAMLQRVDFAYQFADRVTDQEPSDIAEASLGPLLSADTGQAIRHAGSRRDGLTLLLASPDFQRR